MLTRREFIATSAAAGAAVRIPSAPATLPAVITTWDFGKAANAEAWAVLEAGGSAIDAVEKGVNQAEMDPGNTSVGFGGLPDEDGEVSNDAILFWGPPDTVGMVAVDKNGDLCAGTSTSVLAFKIKGRVGDVAIPGAGAYVDNDVGGVAATGNGYIMMRFGLALMAVEFMRAGASPRDACARSLQRIEAKGYRVQACLVALTKKGEFGAARIGFGPFPFAIRNAGVDEVRRV